LICRRFSPSHVDIPCAIRTNHIGELDDRD
jgi:hypothetical protein